MNTLGDGLLTDAAGLGGVWVGAIVIAVGVACSVAMLLFTWSDRRRVSEVSNEAERLAQLKGEIEAVASEVTARLEARTRAAEDILLRAQRALESLDRTAATLKTVMPVVTAAEPAPRPIAIAETKPELPPDRKLEPTSEMKRTPTAEPRVVAAAESPQAPTAEPTSSPIAQAAPVAVAARRAAPKSAQEEWGQAATRTVVDLAEAGLTPVQIAQKLGRPTGQVELILSLRKIGIG